MIDFSLNDLGQFFTGAAKPSTDLTTSTSYTSFEEERRRNMEEVARAPVAPTQPEQPSLGPAVMARAPGAGRGFVNPKYALGAREPAAPTETAPVRGLDQTAYNAGIAQQESGGRQDIGYHNQQLSSAYGPYGMTAGAYEDARKRNPNLPADITQASPAQLTEAQNSFTNANAGYLKNYGVPVNDNTLAAAHFLGAKGLSDYLKTGYISPQAAAANGGEENVRRIVQARLGGQAAPASGATQTAPAAPVSPEQAAQQPTAPAYTGQGIKTPGGLTASQLEQNNTFNTILNSNSMEQIGKAAFDPNTPPQYAAAMLDKLHNTMAIEEAKNRAMKRVAEIQANPTPQNISRAMNDKRDGSILRAIFYGLMGARDKEKEEWDRIDPKTAYRGVTLEDGSSYTVKYNPNTNEVLSAWDVNRKPVGDNILGQISAQGVGGNKLDIVGGTYVNDTTGEVGRVVTDQATGRSYIQTDTGRKPMTGFRPQSSQGTMADMRSRALQDLQIKLIGKTEEEKMQILRPYNQQLVSNGYQPIQPTEVGITAPVVQGAPSQVRPQAQPAAPVAPQGAPAGGQPVVPGTPAATGQVPATAQQPVRGTGPGGRPTAGEMTRASEVAKEEALAGPKAESAGQKDMVEQSTKIVQQFPDLRNITDAVNKSIKIIDSGETNIGPSGSVLSTETKANQLPLEKEAGRFLGTKDARNTKTVMDLVRKLAADGLKALGSNPSTVDLQFWTENKPTEYDSPEYVKEWLQTRKDDLERRIQYHKDVVKNKGRVPEVIPGTPTQTGEKPVLEEKTINGVTYVFDGKGWKRK